MARKRKYLWDRLFTMKRDEIERTFYVRVYRERGEWIVEAWRAQRPVGDPVLEWAMPGVLPMDVAMHQAILQSRELWERD